MSAIGRVRARRNGTRCKRCPRNTSSRPSQRVRPPAGPMPGSTQPPPLTISEGADRTPIPPTLRPKKGLDYHVSYHLPLAMAYATALAVLADPTRRKVFERLRAGPRPVNALAAGLPVSRPAVSQHLKALKDRKSTRLNSSHV